MKTILSNIIKIETKSVYGNDLMYIVSEHAEAIQNLTGKKTIDASDMKQLRTLGFTLEWMTREDVELAKIAELVH